MSNLRITEIRAFVPAMDFECSQQFYQDLGFTMEWSEGELAYFHREGASFLLQDFKDQHFARNFMMHVVVEDVDAWWAQVNASGVAAKFGVRVGDIESQPWGMRDFVLFDPSGVLWRIGQEDESAA